MRSMVSTHLHVFHSDCPGLSVLFANPRSAFRHIADACSARTEMCRCAEWHVCKQLSSRPLRLLLLLLNSVFIANLLGSRRNLGRRTPDHVRKYVLQPILLQRFPRRRISGIAQRMLVAPANVNDVLAGLPILAPPLIESHVCVVHTATTRNTCRLC